SSHGKSSTLREHWAERLVMSGWLRGFGSGHARSRVKQEKVMDEQADRFERPDDGSPRETQGGHPVISGPRARQARKIGAMRYVLGVSLGLVVVVFVVACLITVVYHH